MWASSVSGLLLAGGDLFEHHDVKGRCDTEHKECASAMSKVERIEQRIKGLSAKELAELRDWFLAFDWNVWDGQIERDVQDGKLDSLGTARR